MPWGSSRAPRSRAPASARWPSAWRRDSRVSCGRPNSVWPRSPPASTRSPPWVEAGELKKADFIHQSLQAALDLIESSGLPKGATAALGARLRSLSQRLRDLQHWRRWGADQHREALCAAMEALREQDLPLATVAERLHALKTDWQEVERAGSPANKPLWERFHQAAAVVGERVRPLLAAQATEQDSNRGSREQVCRELEAFLSQVDWERVEWKWVMRAECEVRYAWSLIGPCEPRERRRLGRRYH